MSMFSEAIAPGRVSQGKMVLGYESDQKPCKDTDKAAPNELENLVQNRDTVAPFLSQSREHLVSGPCLAKEWSHMELCPVGSPPAWTGTEV